MKTFEVELAKSYKLTINADNEEVARQIAELYTGDIENIASKEDEITHHFQITSIECTVNEANQVREIHERD